MLCNVGRYLILMGNTTSRRLTRNRAQLLIPFLQPEAISNATKAIERPEEPSNVTYECYENFTVYYPLYESTNNRDQDHRACRTLHRRLPD